MNQHDLEIHSTPLKSQVAGLACIAHKVLITQFVLSQPEALLSQGQRRLRCPVWNDLPLQLGDGRACWQVLRSTHSSTSGCRCNDRAILRTACVHYGHCPQDPIPMLGLENVNISMQ